ncbi:cell division protein ZipA C-terminal FtsZ-binding domain-containing protein [Kingella negevensis]|uniref:cell division protein ZipA C-terminal FtsZ-binding domain-containing protein n=1 Tax=Kingella negevensis TaxID=1522312 RepID=UPI00050A2A25|nr:cell division protein ZipA C-terminal FtsZ-binding domain-containing protein [Kingella negevensis]MDK4688418.1 cell division protein ZipA C-terminal FtsZ-binding domain-containing protein [Kingella negevensis]WII90323.1 cell division protein ZipA C-terminal FtsZ-binding domain-containing protein [Kingella negevensis]
MNIFLIIIILLLAVIAAVIAYNLYQENQYRTKIRSQFGHSDQDALLTSSTQSVRDGKSFTSLLRRSKVEKQPETQADAFEEITKVADNEPAQDLAITPLKFIADDMDNIAEVPEITQPKTLTEEETRATIADIKSAVAAALEQSEEPEEKPETIEDSIIEPVKPAIVAPVLAAEPEEDERPLLVELTDLERSELLWFDKRFDFMGYVALREPKELHAIPRLSGRHRFQIIGCTMDGRFQAAEPIPGVAYQAFVVGLQAISRSGLASEVELEYFARQVQLFANKMDGKASTADIEPFLRTARPLDELCARVDQTIAIHLVSRASVLGTELRSAVEKAGFELMADGTFALSGSNGDIKYTIAALDGSAFTEALLASQPYKGFSMLFDITRVPEAEDDFNEFMTLAVRLSGELGLDLVDDQVRQLSADWLKEVRSYVGARQNEMLKVGIEPGGGLSKRLFA